MTLDKKYNQVMDRVTLSDKQKERITSNILNADLNAVRPVEKKKGFSKTWAAGLSFALIAVLAVAIPRIHPGVSSSNEMRAASAVQDDSELLVGAESAQEEGSSSDTASWTSYEDADALEEASGISIKEVDAEFPVLQTDYELDEKGSAVIVYQGKENTLTVHEEMGYLTVTESGSYGEEVSIGSLSGMIYGESETEYLSADVSAADGMHYLLEYDQPVSKEIVMKAVESIAH